MYVHQQNFNRIKDFIITWIKLQIYSTFRSKESLLVLVLYNTRDLSINCIDFLCDLWCAVYHYRSLLQTLTQSWWTILLNVSPEQYRIACKKYWCVLHYRVWLLPVERSYFIHLGYDRHFKYPGSLYRMLLDLWLSIVK